MYKRTDGGPENNVTIDSRTVTILDSRAIAPELSLDVNGFILAPQSTTLSTEDFYNDPAKVVGTYYEEMKEIVKRATGASRVVVFDHNVRNIQEKHGSKEVISAKGDARNAPVQGYANLVHCDYTPESAVERLQFLCRPSFQGGSYTDLSKPLFSNEEIHEILNHRYMFVNVWRNISQKPIVSHPFAVCDVSTVSTSDYVEHSMIYQDRVGHRFDVHYNQMHKWRYFSRMHKNEVMLLKTMDSKPDVARYTPHTAFEDPNTGPTDPPRESIEARCIAIFGEGDVEVTNMSAGRLFQVGLPSKL